MKFLRAVVEGAGGAMGGLMVGMYADAKQGNRQFDTPRTLVMTVAGGALGVIHGLKS